MRGGRNGRGGGADEKVTPVHSPFPRLHLQHITRGGDPFEALEARPLDYGHWSAHKLEVLSEFQLRHGEAVAIGVAVDTIYSSLMFGLPKKVAQRVLRCLEALGLVLDHPALHDTKALFAGLEEFRQHLGGRLTLTMLKDVGEPFEVHVISMDGYSVDGVKRLEDLGVTDVIVGFRDPYTMPDGPLQPKIDALRQFADTVIAATR